MLRLFPNTEKVWFEQTQLSASFVRDSRDLDARTQRVFCDLHSCPRRIRNREIAFVDGIHLVELRHIGQIDLN